MPVRFFTPASNIAHSLGTKRQAGFGALGVVSTLLLSQDFTTFSAGAGTSGSVGIFSFSRASTAAVQTSSSGVLTGIANDIPRYGSTGSAVMGLVFEESRTNLILNSRLLTGAGWANGTTTTANFLAGPDGLLSGSRLQVNNAANGRSQSVTTVANKAYSATAWVRSTGSNSGTTQAWLGNSPITASWTNTTATWKKMSLINTQVGTTQIFIVADGVNESAFGGITAGARDDVWDMHQIELGGFPTEFISTTTVAATRAGERLYHPTASAVINGGRISAEYRFITKGALSLYKNPIRLWSVDSNNYCELTGSTGVITIASGGTTNTLTPINWGPSDLIELYVAGGGGIASTGFLRVGGASGSFTLFPTGSTLGNYVFSTGSIDILCAGTASQLTAYVQNINFYKSGGVPSWTGAAFTISNIPNLASWWRADLGITLNSTTVSGWQDQSGNSRILLQATGAAQPIYNSSNATFGGWPTLHLTQSARSMVGVTPSDWNFMHNGSGSTVFTVFQAQKVTSQDIIWTTDNASGFNTGSLFAVLSNQNLRYSVGNGSASPIAMDGASNTFTSGSAHIAMVYYGASTGSVRIDRTTMAIQNQTVSPSQGTAAKPFSIGTIVPPINADIAEIITFNRVLSTAEIEQVEQYMRRYGF